jgi:hypothetical protein
MSEERQSEIIQAFSSLDLATSEDRRKFDFAVLSDDEQGRQMTARIVEETHT